MVLSILICVKANGRFKIPNSEVMADWGRWVIGEDIEPWYNILKRWPNFMQQELHPELVTKERGAVNDETPEIIYYACWIGLIQHLRNEGWEISERGAGGNDSDIHLVHVKLS
ncbi:hypothetical protein APHAL10511_003172 [Amanita phalloides]|nr:hypothetical protein APHAL10511_003172 [Amanita phalloides]